MAPKKEAARDEDGEEQYGMLTSLELRKLGLTIAAQAPFTLSLGLYISHKKPVQLLIHGRPVVVAENMIGVAMYELVSSQLLETMTSSLYIIPGPCRSR